MALTFSFPFLRVVCAGVLAVAAVPALADSPMPLTELSIGMYRIEAEVAATQENRMVGLMQRRSMPANHGMLFVFTEQQRHCMWMRNTLLPLSVAFLDEQGRILNKHIELYVNNYSVDLGEVGRNAVEIFFDQARKSGQIPQSKLNLFI